MSKICACGCGIEIPDTSTWVKGHHRRGVRTPTQVFNAIYDERRQSPIVMTEVEEIEFVEEPDPTPVMVKRNLKVNIYPSFGDFDKGDGGIRRVVEAQLKYLPAYGIDLVETAAEADVIAFHATVPHTYLKLYPEKTFVCMLHGFYWSEYDWANWAIKTNVNVMEGIRISDAVISCSEWIANSVRRHTSRDTVVIHHGIDIEDWEPTDSARDYVLWNKTRPDPVCDPEPMNRVAELLPNVKFISTYGEQAKNVALTGRLPFHDAKKLIQNAGVYLCTTRETFGIGTLEALACGIPVVGFDYAGQKEFLTHGKDSYLVTPGDIPALADGIIWGLNNRENISRNCIETARKFTWEIACQKYADTFKAAYAKKNKIGPKVSIIVTNYNLHEYLTDCLNSVQRQTSDDWECIVVDDASTDATGKFIAQTFADEDHRFSIIRNEKNAYLAEARNIGIRSAKGRYILPLDADDMLAPNTVELLSHVLDADRNIHVAYGNVRFVNEDGVTLTDYGTGTAGHSGWPMQFTFEYQIRQHNLLPYCSMYRREAWEQTGGYRRRCRTAEDAEFWTRLSSYGFRPRMVTSEDTLIYRNRPGSMSREQGQVDWTRWFSWAKIPEITPAGAATIEQMPISSLDPIVISVIIPVGPGHEKIVQDAIDSVDSQTFRNWECIVINDTSRPLEVEFPAWVKVIENTHSHGPAGARNCGIEHSKGRLFLPLDADDYLEPFALQVMYDAHLIEHDVIYTDFFQTDMSGKNITVHECDDWEPTLITGGKRTVNGLMREGMLHSVTALTPKKYWEEIGGYDEELPAWEDWDFQLALGNIGVCSRRVAVPLFTYRKHTGFRREENYDSFERSKEGILRKWRHLWEGGKELMACGSCSAKRSYVPPGWGVSQQQSPPQNNLSDDAVLVTYVGSKMGSTPYRGNSKTVYWFGAGDSKYVLKQDLDIFLNIPGFEIVTEKTVASMNSPVLVAEGPPS